VGYGYGINSDSTQSNITSRNYGASFQVIPGIAYRTSKHVLIDLHFSNFLGAIYSHTKSMGTATSAQFNLNAGLSNFTTDNLQFGFRYIL
jgi:hypothetical protein